MLPPFGIVHESETGIQRVKNGQARAPVLHWNLGVRAAMLPPFGIVHESETGIQCAKNGQARAPVLHQRGLQ